MKKFLLITAAVVVGWYGLSVYSAASSMVDNVDRLAERGLKAWADTDATLSDGEKKFGWKYPASCLETKKLADKLKTLQADDSWLGRWGTVQERANAIKAFATAGERCGHAMASGE